jgi:uncharacterized protein
MTDIFSSIATYSSQPAAAVIAPSVASPTVNGSLSDAVVQDDNEDYTIKCICSYGDDDGSTVYCEKCDTWQHIICYYNGKKVPDVHFCAECDPRQLDAKRATESQRKLREHIDGGERKARRPPSKSHKKKKDSVATTEQPNGLHSHGRHESASAGRDQPPPAKRAKTSHRTSTSIASTNGVPTLPEPRKRASSNVNAYPSPIKSPLSQPLQPPIPTYTSEFLNLYEKDRGKNNVDDGRNPRMYSNSMSMAVTNELTSWYDNPFALKQATGGQHQEVFHQSDQPLRPETWPRILLKEKKNTETRYEGRFPRWKCIILDTNVKKDDFIGEIRGDIGRLEDYCIDPETRWSELRHPEPFVFFHPQIPIYIDSRAEGTYFRYVRRSCHPNVTLKTFVTGERDFHHCFVAKENISAGAELTAMWYLDQNLFNNGKVKEENSDEEEAKRRATYFSKILANFGDCACDSTDCWLKNFDLRTPPDQIKKRTEGRRRRGKVKSAASPTSTGQATNSRANSENVQVTEEEDQADSRSTSGSIRSKPQSRDITPANPNQIDMVQDPTQGMSAREKRKILMAEKAFEDQEVKKQKSKRKRTSGGPTISTPAGGPKNSSTSASSVPPTPSLLLKPSQLNTASNSNFAGSPPLSAALRGTTNMSPRKSSVPNTPSPLSRFTRPRYVDREMQTDPEPEEPEEQEPTGPAPGWENCFETPYMRRMRRYMEYERKDKIKKEELKKKIDAGLVSQFAEIVPTWVEERNEKDRLRAERRAKEAKQTEEAAAAIVSPSQGVSHPTDPNEEHKPVTLASTVQLPPPPPPSQAAHTQNKVSPPHSHKLQLSTLPPVPTFSTSTSSGVQASTALSPTPTTPVPQSPFGYIGTSQSYPGLSAGAVAPSPVKKKLSLGDYMSRRSNLTTPAVEKTQAQATATAAAASVSSTVQTITSSQQAPSNAPVSESNLSTIMIRPGNAITAEAEATGSIESSVIVDLPPAKDSNAAGPSAMTTATVPSSTGPPKPPELSSVLSNLQALAGSAARRGSSGP